MALACTLLDPTLAPLLGPDLIFQGFDLREQLRLTLIHSLKIGIAPLKRHLELLHIVSGESITGAEMLGRTRLDVCRAVFRGDLICRPVFRVHISRERLPRYLTAVRHLNSLKSVPGMLVCFKKNAVIEQRRIGNDLVVFKVPWIRVKFQISTPLLSPFLV